MTQRGNRLSEGKLRAAEEDVWSDREMARQAQAAYADWLAGLAEWSIYFTVTYDQKRARSKFGDQGPEAVTYSERACAHHVKRWLSESMEKFRRPLQAVAVVEHQLNGWPHAHGLMRCVQVDGWERSSYGQLWFQKHGYAVLEPFDPVLGRAAGGYLGKYLTKSEPEVVFVGFGGLQGPLFDYKPGAGS